MCPLSKLKKKKCYKEKGEGMKKQKLVVIKYSQGYRVQHKKYSQQCCNGYVQSQMGTRVIGGNHFINCKNV